MCLVNAFHEFVLGEFRDNKFVNVKDRSFAADDQAPVEVVGSVLARFLGYTAIA
jgi:hypothetical protein